ncbi:MAG: FtsQ-type POTRA domain-containing protein [Cyanobacteria bacterium J06641_5]
MKEPATPITPSRRSERMARRQQWQRRRTLDLLQGGWRLLATLGLASSLVWALVLPRWTITSSDEIEIVGDRLLQEGTLKQMLAWDTESSPSLLLLDPQHLAKRLQARAPLSHVSVSRSLLPLSLTVTVVERAPVAVTLPEAETASSQTTEENSAPTTREGLLDATGAWLPKSAFTDAVAVPALQVRGYGSNRDRAQWQHLYASISQASVSVSVVDLRDPDNTILQVADLGSVHLGGSLQRLDEQLATAARLQAALPQHPRADRIAYVDLKNPDAPSVRPTPGET